MKVLTIALAAAAAAAPAAAMQGRAAPSEQGMLILYENKNYTGASYEVDEVRRRIRTGWNVRSIAVHPGDRWQICNRPSFGEPCIILDRSVADAATIGAEGVIASARPAAQVPAR